MAISQASVLVGDLRPLMMWDNKASARINPMDGKRFKRSSQLKFITLKSCKKKVVQKISPFIVYDLCFFDDNFFLNAMLIESFDNYMVIKIFITAFSIQQYAIWIIL